MKEKIFTVLNEAQILCTIWDNVRKPIGVIQIIHGIYDNMQTYQRFAEFMNKNGYIVFGTNRALCPKIATCPNSFDRAVKLQMKIMNYLVQHYRLPLFIFGYGYGGFITQSILEKSNIPTAGVCLAGTGKYPKILLRFIILFTWICTKLFGVNAPANIFNRISAGKHRSQGQIKCTYGFYLALLRGIINIKPETQFDTPILMITDAHETAVMNARFSRALYNAYRDNGMMRLTLIIYPDTCDNLLIEMNFGTIPKDILDFFNRNQTTN